MSKIYFFDFFRIFFSGFLFFCFLGIFKRFWWIVCDSKFFFLVCVRFFLNLFSVFKCWVCKYKFCFMVKCSFFLNFLMCFFLLIGEEVCLFGFKYFDFFLWLLWEFFFLVFFFRMWLRNWKRNDKFCVM